MNLEMSIEDSPPSVLQKVVYGSLYDASRWISELSIDPRWEVQCIIGRKDGKVVGVLPIWHSLTPKVPRNFVTSQMTNLGFSDSQRCLQIGSHSRLIGGAAVVGRTDRWDAEDCLVEMVRHAVQVAEEASLRPVALYVPHGQLAGFVRAWPEPASIHKADVFSRLELRTDRLGQPYHQSNQVRTRWEQDKRNFDKLDLTAKWESVTGNLINEGAPLVAAVSTRNGVAIDHRITAFQLRNWWKFKKASARVLTLRDTAGNLAGVSFARINDKALELYEIGMPNDFEDRRALYASLLSVEPMRFAAEAGLEVIELGAGHPLPKILRGADQEPLWHVM